MIEENMGIKEKEDRNLVQIGTRFLCGSTVMVVSQPGKDKKWWARGTIYGSITMAMFNTDYILKYKLA